MNKDKEEAIKQTLLPPNDWQWGDFLNVHHQKIRFGYNVPKNARALIILAQGRTECIEEYFELIRDLNGQGYACAIMDWQGQGESYRFNDDNTRHHSNGFEHDIHDFECFLGQLTDLKLPRVLVAHSMGGNIMLRYLMDHHADFQCAYLIAPMLGLNPPWLMRYIAPFILKIMTMRGRLDRYAWGQKRWSKTLAHIAKYKVSSDPVRREKQPYLFEHYPQLQCGGVTWGWLKSSLSSIAILHTKSNVATIQTPCHIAIAGRDVVVDNKATKKVVSLVNGASYEVFHKSEHQIHIEKDEIRKKILTSMYQYIEKHLS